MNVANIRGIPVAKEVAELRKIFPLRNMARIVGVNYDLLKDHFYGVSGGMRNAEKAQKIKELHAECKAKGWI